ncbi:MAG: SUMF1/EgtB/PvdO family nonheme iron enzyme [Bacteroidales bacterium]|nr:SUMF1/EgtB/PvdO family nonheme iron enzyme [Candidatus Cryptobacteroides choladohippi]
MRKLIFAISAVAALAFASCQKVDDFKDGKAIDAPYVFNFIVATPDGGVTKAVKTDWAAGDKINLWFDGAAGDPQVILAYDGAAWNAEQKDASLALGASGKASALYEGHNDLSKLDGNVPLVISCEQSDYSVEAGVVSACLEAWDYETPIQIVVPGITENHAAYTLSCENLCGGSALEKNSTGAYTEFSISGNAGEAVTGVGNGDGAAFYFVSSDAGDAQQFTFTLTFNEKAYTYTSKETTISAGAAKRVNKKLPAFSIDDSGNPVDGCSWKADEDAPQTISFTVNGITFNMVRIPAATFWMGSPMIDYYYDEDEILHQVKISKDYYLGEFEVTNQLYNSLISGHSSNWSYEPQQPVTDIWRADAESFCAKLSEKLGVSFRLPTEAELEWAARGGDETGEKSRPFPLNAVGKFDANMANFMDGMYYDVNQLGPDWFGYVMKNPWDELKDMQVMKVGSYAPNAYGLYDIIGNVAEYCQDYYSANFYKECAKQGLVVDPVNTTYDGMTVAKGGAFGSDLNRCRIPYHMPMMTDPIPPFMMNPTSGGGIRLCLTAE